MTAKDDTHMLLIYDIRSVFLKLGLPHEMNVAIRMLPDFIEIRVLYLMAVEAGNFSFAPRLVLETWIESKRTGKSNECVVAENLYNTLNVEFSKLIEFGRLNLCGELTYLEYKAKCEEIQKNVIFDTINEFTNVFNSTWWYLRR